MTTTSRMTRQRMGLRALAVSVTTSALAALAVVVAAPASAAPTKCEMWLSGSRGQTLNGRCTAGTGKYYTRAVRNDGRHAYGSVVGIGRVSSAICFDSDVHSGAIWPA